MFWNAIGTCQHVFPRQNVHCGPGKCQIGDCVTTQIRRNQQIISCTDFIFKFVLVILLVLQVVRLSMLDAATGIRRLNTETRGKTRETHGKVFRGGFTTFSTHRGKFLGSLGIQCPVSIEPDMELPDMEISISRTVSRGGGKEGKTGGKLVWNPQFLLVWNPQFLNSDFAVRIPKERSSHCC